MTRFTYLRNTATLALDQEKCSGCGMCLNVCPHAVFAKKNGKAMIKDRDSCMECGACAMNCPETAISVQTGVGCAAAVINSAFGSNVTGCDCTIAPVKEPASKNDCSGGSCCC